jgi:hypothetical protein
VTIFSVAMAMMAGSGCARRVPQPAVKTPGEPLVSWIIMFGDQDNPDREFACQSHPLTECAMPPSRPDAQVVSEVHFYYHGVPTDTNYSGVNRIGFFQGSGGQVAQPHGERRRRHRQPGVIGLTSTPATTDVDRGGRGSGTSNRRSTIAFDRRQVVFTPCKQPPDGHDCVSTSQNSAIRQQRGVSHRQHAIRRP